MDQWRRRAVARLARRAGTRAHPAARPGGVWTIHREGFTHVLLLGMGGSSLAPEVLRLSFGRLGAAPTSASSIPPDPAQVLAAEARCDLARTLVIVASKSGSTLEPNVFLQYIQRRGCATRWEASARRAKWWQWPIPGRDAAGRGARAVRRNLFGDPSMGRRCSALSPFGLVPAAVMGIDVERFVAHAQAMATACRAADAATNPGVALGVALGVAALRGRDKLTITASPWIPDLGASLEQLVAESTGKQGKAIIPVILKKGRMPPAHYGDDRVFVSLATEAVRPRPRCVARRARARGAPGDWHHGHRRCLRAGAGVLPAGRLRRPSRRGAAPPPLRPARRGVGGGIATRAIASAYEATGELPAETAVFEEDGLTFYADAANAAALADAGGTTTSATCCRRTSGGWVRVTTSRAAGVPADARATRGPAGRHPRRNRPPDTGRPRASGSGHGSCTRRGRPTRAAATTAC